MTKFNVMSVIWRNRSALPIPDLVTTILSKFPLKTSQEDISTGLDIQNEKHRDTKDEVLGYHEGIIAELDKLIMITPQKNRY